MGMSLNCISRLISGLILEKLRFKIYFGLILITSSILAFSYYYICSNTYLFTLYIAATYYVMGAMFVSMPIYYAAVFGADVGS